MRKILPQAYGGYSEDKIFRITQVSGKLAIYGWALVSVHPEIGKFGRDQGMRKILPQAYGGYSEDKIFRITQISGKLAIYGWALVNWSKV